MRLQDHIINRQVLEVSFSSRTEARKTQAEVSQIYRDDLLPLIEEIFDEVANENEYVRIDRLEIDLSRISRGRLREDLMTQLRKKLRDALQKTVQRHTYPSVKKMSPVNAIAHCQHDDVSVRSSQLNDLELFLYFIETGRLPWWTRKHSFTSIADLVEKLIDQHPSVLSTTIRSLDPQDTGARRIIYQLPDAILTKLLHMVQPGIAGEIHVLHRDLYAMQQHRQLLPLSRSGFRLKLWQHAFEFCSRDLTSFPAVAEKGRSTKANDVTAMRYLFSLIGALGQTRSLSGIQRGDDSGDLVSKVLAGIRTMQRAKHIFETPLLREKLITLQSHFAGTRQLTSKETLSTINEQGNRRSSVEKKRAQKVFADHDDEGIEIHNAGLVVLGAFLPAFFEGIGLTYQKAFVTADAAQRAALLLQYIATRETEVAEYDLLLNKLLCGIDMDAPLPASIDLSDVERQEVDHLLNTIASRWTALKGTSGESMRRTFMIREGILSRNMNGWKLTIERSGVDMLLDKLPWSISMIKLPWCEQMLVVEW